jgi:hypothetical protein
MVEFADYGFAKCHEVVSCEEWQSKTQSLRSVMRVRRISSSYGDLTKRDSVTGLILSVKWDLSTCKVRRISSPRGLVGAGSSWIIWSKLNQKGEKFKCYNFGRGVP